jgi:hypothetical protein
MGSSRKRKRAKQAPDAEELCLIAEVRARPRHVLIQWEHVDGVLKGTPVTHTEWRRLTGMAKRYGLSLAELLKC